MSRGELIRMRARLSHCDSALGCTLDGRWVDSSSQSPYLRPSAAIWTIRSVSKRCTGETGSGVHRLCASSMTINRPMRFSRFSHR